MKTKTKITVEIWGRTKQDYLKELKKVETWLRKADLAKDILIGETGDKATAIWLIDKVIP
jgi:hypothetical protein